MESSIVAPSAIVLELLNMDNYEYWSRWVKTYLLADGLWKVVEAPGDPPKLEDGEEKLDAWSRQNAKALHVIHISCGSGLYPLISDTDSARVAWDLLARKLRPARLKPTDERSDFPTPVDGARCVHDENVEIKEEEVEGTDDKRSDFSTPVDDGRRVHDENVEIKEEEEEATDVGHENNAANVALQEPYALFKIISSHHVDWDEVTEFLNRHPEAVRIRHPKTGYTGLHMAVFNRDAKGVQEMVRLMEEEDLEIKDADGFTAFYYAVGQSLGNIKIVECLVRKNNALVSTCIDFPPYENLYPALLALSTNNFEVADYLYRRTPKESLKPENGPNGADIISTCLRRKKFSIALDLIQRYPKLAITKDFDGNCPLNLVAGMRSAFLSGTPMTFYQRWIYHCIHIEDFTSFDACIDVLTPEIDEENQMDLNESAIGRHVKLPLWQHIRTHCNVVRSFFQELLMTPLKLLGIFDHIYEMKLVHVRVLQLLKCMSEVTRCGDIRQLHDSVVQRAIFRAVQYGHVEFVSVLVTQNPSVMLINDKRCRNFFEFAIECRQEKVYNLIYDLTDESLINSTTATVDYFRNSILHIAGTLSSFIQFNHIRDAALQMQRELQWFKEVENLVSPGLHETVNLADNMTGRELFTKNHKEMVKEGEKSMKETASSCTVVGALIITIMFSAAFTVAGGNNQNTGLPMFLDERLFMVFIVSDALSLFSSTTSVMIFLGILTSRYAENDFLTSLPTKMMVGLLTLLLSIATMMVAFSTTLIIMLHDKYSWIVVPIISLACIPITSFVWMQFPLLKEICVSTYGPGIFGKRRSLSQRHRLKMFYARMKGKL